jgi:hypothetical protein
VAGGIGIATTALATFGAVMNDIRDKTQQTLQAMDALVESRRRLLQISSSGADTQAMNDQADSLARMGISRADARNIVFSARSEGYVGSEAEIARLAAANVLTPESAARAAGQVRGIFKNITPMQAIVGVKQAAEQSRLDIEQFMQKMPKLAGGAKVAGSSAAEANAILSAVATEDERAGEYVATLANQLAVRPEFADQPGIMGMVGRLGAMDEDERRSFLGTSKEANLAYMWLTDYKELIAQRTRENQSAMDDVSSFVASMEAKAYDPSTQEGRLNMARRRRQQAAAEAEIAQERNLGEKGLRSATAFDLIRAEMQNDPTTNPFSRWAAGALAGRARDVNAPDAVIRGAAALGQSSRVPIPVAGQSASVQELTGAIQSLIGQIQQAGRDFRQSVGGGADDVRNVNRTNAARARQAAVGGAVEAR